MRHLFAATTHPGVAARRTANSLALVAVLLQPPSFVWAQAVESGGRRIVATTRLVARYSDLESKLISAIQHKDEAALSKLLAEDFEQWSPDPPGNPVPREEWLKNAPAALTLKSSRLRQAAVRMVGEIAVVSFVQSQRTVCDGRKCDGDFFVVDLWLEQKDPQLIVRYAANIKRLPQSPSKPTGKE